jgi:hypothetical protein
VRVTHSTRFAYNKAVDRSLVSIIETEEFIERARKIMTAEQQDDLLLFLARYPEAGDIIPDSGGVRKLRWLAKGRGKRGGSRVIYYFHDISMPLVLFTAYAKNRQTDLSAKERKELRNLVDRIVEQLKPKRRG